MERKQWTVEDDLLEFEPPDVFYLHVKSTQTVASAKAATDVMQQAVTEAGRLMIVVAIIGENVSFPAETRKYYASVPPLWREVIVVGGSMVLRAAINVIVRAMSLLGGGKLAPTRFVKNLEEAHAAIAEFRKSEEQASAAKA